jgi:hypothetical protein
MSIKMRGVGRLATQRSASWVLSALGVGLSVHACAIDDAGYEFGRGGSGGSAGFGAAPAGGLAGAGAGVAGKGTSGQASAVASGGSSFEGGAANGTGGASLDTACGGVVCASAASCVKTAESAECQCPPGYLDVRGDGSSCEDIDECASENGGCDALVPCQNTPGGSSCGGCPPGYTAEGGECVDIDECEEANGDCDALAGCTNTPGGFSCGNCPFGFEADAKGSCIDIDECATANGGCDASAACNNTEGGFTCGDCPAGYSGGGDTSCVDIDECATDEGGCDPLAGCTNKAGGFSCGECPAGYAGSGAGGCVDIDECATNNGGCDVNAACTDLDGSRTCSCKAGYSGDGMTCADINECATNNGGCHANADCTNQPGARTCSCKAGYSGDGMACADINECAANNGGCALGSADCANMPGSRTCTCKDGYTGNGTTCTCAVTTPQCVNSTTQRSCSGNTLTQTTCTGPSPLCVAGQGCQSCNTVRCGTTCCAPPPADATAICNPSTTCAVKCNPNFHSCSGTQSPCYQDSDPQHCGGGCVDCTQPNANPRCMSGVCMNTCKGSTLTCAGVGGKPACGSWSFESSKDPMEGFTLDSASTTAYGGPLKVVNRRATNGTYSLAIPYDNGGNTSDGMVDVKFQVCPGGAALNLSNYLLSMDLYIETTSGPSFERNNGNYVLAYNGSEYVYGGCDSQTPDEDGPFDWECSSSSFPTNAISTIVLRFRMFVDWQGTFYIDNVRLDPK